MNAGLYRNSVHDMQYIHVGCFFRSVSIYHLNGHESVCLRDMERGARRKKSKKRNVNSGLRDSVTRPCKVLALQPVRYNIVQAKSFPGGNLICSVGDPQYPSGYDEQ